MDLKIIKSMYATYYPPVYSICLICLYENGIIYVTMKYTYHEISFYNLS